MPQLYCNIPAGISPEKKKVMLEEIVAVTHRCTGSHPSIISVIVYEISEANYVINGRVRSTPASEKTTRKP